MALGIHKDSSMVVYELPLVGSGDSLWNDNTWICEHLRQLADKIEDTNFQIMSIGVQTLINNDGAKPELIIKGYERQNNSFGK